MEESYHHGALRQALLESAMEILEEGSEVSLRAVARRAGVSHAAPYHHFTDRRALLAAVAQEGLASLRYILLAAGKNSRDDPQDLLVDVGLAYVRFAMQHRALFGLIFSAELTNREGLPELQAAYDEAKDVVRGFVRHFLGPDADPDDIRFRTLRAWSTVHGLAHLILENQVIGVETIEDAEQVARRVFRTGTLAMLPD